MLHEFDKRTNVFACPFSSDTVVFTLLPSLQSLLEELLIHKPEDPISFLIDALKRENSDGG